MTRLLGTGPRSTRSSVAALAGVVVMLAIVAAACVPPSPAPARPVSTTRPAPPPPPPPPPPLPNAPGGQAAATVGVDFGGTRGVQFIDFPDPFVLRVDSPAPTTYYAYSTGSGFTIVQMIKSTDLTHWSWVGDAFAQPGQSKWAELFGFTWAPTVLERPGNAPSQRFVMYYTSRSIVAGSLGYQCIGRATSATPTGPFTDNNATPLICDTHRGGSVDPNPIVVNGNVYLQYQSAGIPGTEPSRIWGAPLTADGLSIGGATQLLQTLVPSWELPAIEGPSMMPAPGGGFLLFYSAGDWQTANYTVAVAWCATPTTPCTRIYATPVLATRGSMAGPGGESVFQDQAGNWFMVFHAWTAPAVGYPANGKRSMRILSISFPNGGHNPAVG